MIDETSSRFTSTSVFVSTTGVLGQLLEEHQYVDEALSGVGVEHRPAYRRLLAALVGTPPFEVLLVDDLSRLSRDAAEIEVNGS